MKIMSYQPEQIDCVKRELRQAHLQARLQVTPRCNRQIVARLMRLVQACRPKVVAAVWPLAGEVDLRPLCYQLARAGYQIALPETMPKGQPLRFRQWREGQLMHKGRFGTSYPKGSCIHPDMIFVPCVAFDRHGGRLGYGGGYYDRTLPLYPHAKIIGYGFAVQEAINLPMGQYDQRLNVVVTELETIQIDGVKDQH